MRSVARPGDDWTGDVSALALAPSRSLLCPLGVQVIQPSDASSARWRSGTLRGRGVPAEGASSSGPVVGREEMVRIWRYPVTR